MTYTFSILIKTMVAIAFAVILGNGCVVAFNRIPVDWFEDFDDNGERKLPDALLRSIEEGRQRLPSTPWKYFYTAAFGLAGVFLATREPLQFEVAALIVLAIVLEMAISDALYRIVPDQFSILLAVSAIGFISFYDKWWEPLAGAALGLVLAMSVYGLGKLIYHRETIGGADIKFYITMGLVAGRSGIIVIFVLTTIFTAIMAVYTGIRAKKGRASYEADSYGVVKTAGDSQPMMPAAFAAVAIYLLFMWSTLDIIVL